MKNISPDPLLKSSGYIDPSADNGYSNPSGGDPLKTPDGSNATPQGGASDEAPDWLPTGWRIEHRVRVSGATAGHKDKYYFDPISSRRFRSKKEVLAFLESGNPNRRKSGSAADDTPGSNKRKKVEPTVSWKNFRIDDVPEKVKWVLTDAYEGSWSPLVGGDDRVAEFSKQEWSAAFRHFSLQKNAEAVHL